jgi:hypothetical protein
MGRIKMLLISRLNGGLLRWANRRLVQVDEDLSKLACVDREHDSADSKSRVSPADRLVFDPGGTE